VFVEPQRSDPEVLAKKRAVNPNVRTPGLMEWITDDDGRIVNFRIAGETVWSRFVDLYSAWFFNNFVTYIPLHFVRQAYLRAFGASIGKDTAINRGTNVWSIRLIVIGDRVSIGFRCLLDARAGIAIGDDVIIASDTHMIAGGHDINHPDFPPSPNPPDPIVIDHHVWIASRAMILPCLIGSGAVVAAHAVVQRHTPARNRRRRPRQGHRQTKSGRSAVQREVQGAAVLTPKVTAGDTFRSFC
jgi:acetyltransferase-like isoleucine patch superfamily enzyme